MLDDLWYVKCGSIWRYRKMDQFLEKPMKQISVVLRIAEPAHIAQLAQPRASSENYQGSSG